VPNERILILEDEAPVLEMCRRVLTPQGYQLSLTTSGQEAVGTAAKQPFDLFLTDINIPDINGLEAYRQIKHEQPDINGVAITGYATVDMVVEALRLGFSRFLCKPFRPEQLSQAIVDALATERLRRENAQLRTLVPLIEISQALFSTLDREQVLQLIVEAAAHGADSDLASVMLFDDQSGDLVISAGIGLPPDVIRTTRIRLGEGIAGRVAQTGEGLLLRDDVDVPPEIRQAMSRDQIMSALCLPLKRRDRVMGVLNLSRLGQRAPFSQGDLELITLLAAQAAIAIDNAQLHAELQRAYDDLQQLDRLKSEFIGVVSHELRTPLHAITGCVQLLRQGKVPDPAMQDEFLDIVADQTKHLAGLINDLLDLSRIQHKDFEIKQEPVEIGSLVHVVMDRLQAPATVKSINLTASVAADLPLLMGDSGGLERVISNLVDNGIKFTPPGGQVLVTVRQELDQLHLSVQDTGIGITPEAIPKIFDRFYQVDSSTTRQAGGVGLGLYISREIVKQHGGRIWVESELGRGSTFHVFLPITPCPAGRTPCHEPSLS
jgi:signal transduction histidine kinase